MQTERPRKASYVGAPAVFRLELACQQVQDAFGADAYGIYLVGSALERPDWRDVDLVLIMPDEGFRSLFPAVVHLENASWEHDPRWLLMVSGISRFLSDASGLPVDFKFQPQSYANARHKGRRDAVGMRIAHHD